MKIIKKKTYLFILFFMTIASILFYKNIERNESNNINILNAESENTIRLILNKYQTNDGGYRYYENNEYTLYYSYYSVYILNHSKKLNYSDKEKIKQWIEKLDKKFIDDLENYSLLSNIYYYVQIAKIVDYKIPDNIKKQIEDNFLKLENEYGYSMSTNDNSKNLEKFDPTIILSNSLAIKISNALNFKLNEEKMILWSKELLRNQDNDTLKKVRNMSVALEILKNANSVTLEDLEYAKEIFESTPIPKGIDVIDVYYVHQLTNFLSEEFEYITNNIDYGLFLDEFFSKEKSEDIVFLGLALMIADDIGYNYKLDQKSIEIISHFQSDGSYSNQVSNKSDIIETFYAYKILSFFHFNINDISKLRLFIKNNDGFYDKMSDFEKLLFLSLKYDAKLNTSYDNNRIKNLYILAEKHDLYVNHFIVEQLLSLSNKYNYKLESSLLDKIQTTINENINNVESENKDISIVQKMYLYSLSSKIGDKVNSDLLEKKIINEFIVNQNEFNEFRQILTLLIESGIKIDFDESNRFNELIEETEDRINYCLEHEKLEFGKNSGYGILELYYNLELLSKRGEF